MRLDKEVAVIHLFLAEREVSRAKRIKLRDLRELTKRVHLRNDARYSVR